MQMSGFFGATRRNGRFVLKEIEKSSLGNDWQSKANFFGRKKPIGDKTAARWRALTPESRSIVGRPFSFAFHVSLLLSWPETFFFLSGGHFSAVDTWPSASQWERTGSRQLFLAWPPTNGRQNDGLGGRCRSIFIQ